MSMAANRPRVSLSIVAALASAMLFALLPAENVAAQTVRACAIEAPPADCKDLWALQIDVDVPPAVTSPAIAPERTVDPGCASESGEDVLRIVRAARAVGVSQPLRTYSGPLSNALTEPLREQMRSRGLAAERLLAPFQREGATCATIAGVIPVQSYFMGYRLLVADESNERRFRPCEPRGQCEAGLGYFSGEPIVQRNTSVQVVSTSFSNASPNRAQHARLVILYRMMLLSSEPNTVPLVAPHVPDVFPFSNLASKEAHAEWVARQEAGVRLNTALADLAAAKVDRRTDTGAYRRLLDETGFIPAIKRMREKFAVKIESQRIAGVATEIITPADRPADPRRVLINLHGGGMMVGGRYGGEVESIPLAALGGFKIVAIDYRMAPEHRFPAASEDVAAVYRELLKSHRPQDIGIYGCSAGADLTAQSVAWFRHHGLPRPGAVGMFGSVAAIADNLGDAYVIDRLFTGRPIPEKMVIPNMYLEGVNLQDPLVSPAYFPEELAAFPPSLLITGTRDLGMSMTIYSHARLIEAGARADLHVIEGAFHCSFNQAFNQAEIAPSPETRHAREVIVRFFTETLGQPDNVGSSEHPSRIVALEGAANFRDLGGYTTADGRRVRWGLLYRSDALDSLTPEDWQKLEALQITRITDFRTDREVLRRPDRLPPRLAGTVVRLPLDYLPKTEADSAGVTAAPLPSRGSSQADLLAEIDQALLKFYPRFVRESGPEYGAWLKGLLEGSPHSAQVFHCTGGADRTGFAAAILLLALGVPRDQVMQDYLLTNRFLYSPKGRKLLDKRTITPLPDGVQVHPRYLEAALEQIRVEYGTFEAYLRDGLGIDDATREQLRARYLQ